MRAKHSSHACFSAFQAISHACARACSFQSTAAIAARRRARLHALALCCSCVYHLTARLESAWLRARVYVYRSHYDGACVRVCAVWLCVNHGREIPYRMCCYAVFARFKRAHTSRQQCGTSTHAVLDCALCTLIKCHCNAIQMLNFKVKY